MRATDIKSCYIGPEISPEQFVPEHFFLYIGKGTIHGYDGNKNYTLKSGEYCIVRKNRLARYNKERENGEFEKIVVIFDKLFLNSFRDKHKFTADLHSTSTEAFVVLPKDELIDNFIQSLTPYYKGTGKIDEQFADLKREELLLILLQANPGLASVFFHPDTPEKLNLEAFMNKNFKFNVSIERFAFLTGRSVSGFKRDFEKTFQNTPGKWLTQKRLEEAHFLITNKKQKPVDIYLDLGFEDLSHFSFAFKKQFGMNPSELVR